MFPYVLTGIDFEGLEGCWNCIFVDRGIPIGAEDVGTEAGNAGTPGEGGGSGRRVGEVSRGMLGKEEVTGVAEDELEKLLVGMMCERDEDEE